MTKIEELKAAYEAATQGEWRNSEAAVYKKGTNLCIAQCYVTKSNIDTEHDANAHLITLMHNNLPALLEAASLLDDLINSYDDTGCDGCGVVDSSINERAVALREKLQ